MNLSNNQRRIVEHIDGPLLVKAGPGSGKTRVIIERIKHLLHIKKRGKVLALTFSNMAAEEMRTRLETDSDIGDSIDRVTIGTIHSFCLEIIQSRGYLVGLRSDVSLFESEIDRNSILSEVILNDQRLKNVFRQQQKPSAFLSNCLSVISDQKRSFITPELCELETPFPEIYQKYNEVMFNQNAMDFDDILFFAYRILAENHDVVKLYNSVYHYICVDESQDLNKAQYSIIQALCGSGFSNIMMVGDENQSIYAFNGSSSKYMSELFGKDFNPTVYTLNENFRSAKQIIQFANSLTDNNEDVEKYFYEGEISFAAFENERVEAQAVGEKIQELLTLGHKDIENPLEYNNFAVIARNKYVLSEIEKQLTESEIPFYYKKTQSGINFEADYLEAFDLMLRLIMNPMDMYHKQLLCKKACVDLSSCILESNSSKLIEQLLYQSKYEWLSSALPYITNENVFNFDKALLALKSNIPSTLSDDDRYLLVKDIDEWDKHWNIFKSRVASENRSLISFRNAISLGKTQDATTETGVALLTVHMSKGMEFEVVFIVGLSEGTFPDYRAVNNGGEAMAQERNNIYVAVTRAKRLCYLSYPKIKWMPWGDNKKQKPSRFISNSIISNSGWE